jgi:hypothetical protein
MNHEDGNNLVESPGNLGIDPETAANDIREILAAGGKGSGILAQRRALLEWADKVRRRYSESFWIAEARVGGLEHLVWHDTDFRLVRKATHGGSFGRTVRSLDRGLVPATPLEYFDRWTLHNQIFAPITKVSGILERAGGELSILIQQEPLLGDLPSQMQIADFMDHFGFTPLSGKRFAWMSRVSQTVIFDARPANFVLVDRTPIPFDLITLPVSQVSGLPLPK